MKIYSQSGLTANELDAIETQLKTQGYDRTEAPTDAKLQPNQYRKKSRTCVIDNLFNGTWWTISWRPSSASAEKPGLATVTENHQKN